MYAVVKDRRAPGAAIKNVSKPEIKSDEVLVEVKAASICGTDVHIWDWNWWAQERIKPPIIIGHEFCGEVVEVGENVKTIQEGDMVSAETHIVDGTCYQCRTGRMHVCRNTKVLGVDRDGAFTEYVAIPEMNAWKNDPNLDPMIASIQEPLGNAVHSAMPESCVDDIGGAYAAVMGCGPIGLMSIAVLKALGARKVFATEISPYRMKLGREMGADMVLNPMEEDVVAAIMEATEGRGVDIVLEMSGAPSAVRQAFEILTPGGRISLLGILDRPIEIDLNNLVVFKAARVYGITGRRMFETWYQVKGLLSKPDFREKIAKIITHRIPMRDIAEGIELLHEKQAAKVGLTPEW